MLERGQAVNRTARHCGFGSEETMRRGFLRVLGTNPRDYRERFGHAGLPEGAGA
jgi:transcriptional regulator GlxA family with amidase domain